MSQPPYSGGPSEGGDPSGSQGGQGPDQPGGGQNPQQPQGEPNPQYPPQSPQYPPQGPQYPPSGPSPQYPQGQPGPVYSAGGQGPPNQPPGSGQFPPGGPPGPFGGPFPPPRPERRTGLIVGVLVAVGVLFAGLIGLWGINMMRDSGNEAATDSTSEAEPETTGPPPVTDFVGQCLPFSPVLSFDSLDLSTPCDSAEAFWVVTAASDTSGATVDADGVLTDNQPVYDLCGADWGQFELGELWRDWYFTYDSATRLVEDLLCVEAIGNPDLVGRLPITPDTGACFDDSDRWWTVPCELPEALYVVTDTVAVEPPRVMDLDEAEAESAPCSSGAFFWQVTDVEGRTTAILCGDQR